MKRLILVIFLVNSIVASAQIRAFENSQIVLPWVFNPAAAMSPDMQVYVGYDSRGNGNFTPQTGLAGIRLPVLKSAYNNQPSGIAGLQLINTSYDLAKETTFTISYAHQIAINNRFNISMGVGIGMYFMNFDLNELTYLDSQDPLLNNGESFSNLHLNAGISINMDHNLFLNVATPYLLKNDQVNFKEVIVRCGYNFTVNENIKLLSIGSLETYNQNIIPGIQLKAEYQEVFALFAGVDRYKYHGGIFINVKPFAFSYAYGRNIENAFNNIQSHQLAVITNIPVN